MNKIAVILIACLLTTSLAFADDWNINQNHVKLGVVDAVWTIDKKFTGTKALFDARYTVNRKMGEAAKAEGGCPPPAPFERLIGVLDGDFQYGDSETDLEYMVLAVTSLAYQRNIELKARKFMAVRDTLEWGQLLYSFDDPLGIDEYTEFTLARGSRTWAYTPSEKSPWSISLGVKVSLGWAWASSIEPVYKDVSNMIIGGFWQLILAHETWGQIYTDDRVVNGTTIDSPPVNGSISREARIRAGYFKKFKSGWTIDLFLEKRSFNFADPVLRDLYTKSRRIGAEVGYQF